MKDIANERESIKNSIESKKIISRKFKEYKSEFSKIVWLTKKDLFKQTISVLVICIIFFIIIFCMDFALNKFMEIFSKIVS